MSTRGRIGVLRPDGRVESIYNHYDSYLSALGEALRSLNNPADIDELIKLGDRRSTFKDEDWRDPKDIYGDPSRFDDNEDAYWDNDEDWDIDFKYLFDPNDSLWYYNGRRKLANQTPYKNPGELAKNLNAPKRTPLTITNPQAGITSGEGGVAPKLIGSKSKFAQKYPDRFAKLQKSKVYGEGRTAEDVDWDEIAGILGVDLK